MPAIEINRWMDTLIDRLRHSRQRQLVLLHGTQAWCDTQLERLVQPRLLVSDRHAHAVELAKADGCLGREFDFVAVDLFDGLNPDVLCIAAGLLREGGVLLLLAPPVDEWQLERDRYGQWQAGTRAPRAHFVEYFIAAIELDPEIGLIVRADVELPPIPTLPKLQPTPIEQGQTAEQARILASIDAWLREGSCGVALISADRGRGKSTCLGLLAQRLQQQNDTTFLLTANSRQTAWALLQHAPEAEFVAPDLLLASCPRADLVMVDEAAMLPQGILRELSRIYPRMILATTTGGYEGTGQGFRLRFVDQMAPDRLLRLELESPVRWCAGDRLESWMDRVLMLTPKSDIRIHSSAAAPTDTELTDMAIESIDHLQGAQRIDSLRQIYALMVAAHYRTRPSDLRMLMENPDLIAIVARCGTRFVGVLILNLEGGLDAALCEDIYQGRRRPRGHLLAQMLTAQAGVPGFAVYRGARIQRIAVASEYRRCGVGRRLVAAALDKVRNNSLDYLGAAFALDVDSAAFWRQTGFGLVHVCYAQGKSSGSQSIAVLQTVNPELDETVCYLRQRLQRQLPMWLTQFLDRLESAQVVALLQFAEFDTDLDGLDLCEVEAFARGKKGFELCFVNLQRFVMRKIARGRIAPAPLLVEKAIQNRSWHRLEREGLGTGRRQLQRQLRRMVDALIETGE